MAKKKKTAEEWDRLTYEEKRKLSFEEREEMLLAFEERFEREAPELAKKVDQFLQDFLLKLADLDTFLADKRDDIDILFCTQSEFLDRNAYHQHVKEDLEYYVSSFDDKLSDDQRDAMWDRVTRIEKQYERLLA